MNLKKPTNLKELQSLLGIINYHRKFIKDLAMIAAPLNKLLRRKIIVNDNTPVLDEDLLLKEPIYGKNIKYKSESISKS